MHITSHSDQYKKDHPGLLDTSLMITVDYIPKKGVQGIIAVHAYEYDTKSMINISDVMVNHFSDALDEMLESINWEEVYAETMADKKEVA